MFRSRVGFRVQLQEHQVRELRASRSWAEKKLLNLAQVASRNATKMRQLVSEEEVQSAD